MKYPVKILAVFILLAGISCGVSEETKSSARQLANEGTENFNNKNYDKAIELYSKSLDLYNGEAQVFFYRGYAYYSADKCDEAIKDFDQVLEMNPEEGKAYYFRALCNNKLGAKDSLIDDFQKAEKYTRENGPENIHNSALQTLQKSEIELLD